MKNSDLGFDYHGQNHNSALTPMEQSCLSILEERGTGADAAISAIDLVVALGLEEEEKRDVRRLVNHLIIEHSIPIICRAGSGGGYFLAGNQSEVQEFYETYRKRAMTGLVKASRGKKSAFVEMVTQLTLGFDNDEGRDAIEKLRLTPDKDAVPAWVRVVTQFLDRLADDPQRYADQIRKIQEKYGDIFIPRDKLQQIRRMSNELQQLLKSVA
ncbi:MAG: hypothetical protein JXA07_04060 [Spirochaetes bacterium]|nr:hypothetical protein [Spirochaetota bacterium]